MSQADIGCIRPNIAAAQNIAVLIDGQSVDFSSNPPFEQNGSVLVPLRGVFEALGAGVNPSSETQTIEATRVQTDVILRLGQDTAYINGQSVPLRFVAQSFGAEVNWIGETQTVEIRTHRHHDSDDDNSAAGPAQSYPPVPDDVQNTVFNWQEVPVNQTVPIQVASFDQDGYQVVDAQGETIIVPFTNNNLYAMQFGLSNTGSMYLVNRGDVVVLYLPAGGYVTNASVPDARWYPFSGYEPEAPVYMAVAPTWAAYRQMGWYPHTYVHGGYQRHRSGAPSAPTVNFGFTIGDVHIGGWIGFQTYNRVHPNWSSIAATQPQRFQWANRPHQSRAFVGTGNAVTTRPFVPKAKPTPATPVREQHTWPAQLGQPAQSSHPPVVHVAPSAPAKNGLFDQHDKTQKPNSQNSTSSTDHL